MKMKSNYRVLTGLILFMSLACVSWVVSRTPDYASEEADRTTPPTPEAASIVEHEGRYTIRVKDMRMDAFVRDLASVSGVDISLDERLAEQRLTLQLVDASIEDVLGHLSESYAHVYETRDEDAWDLVSATITARVDEVPVEEETIIPVTEEMPGGVLSNTHESRRNVLTRDRKMILLQNAIIDAELAAQEGFTSFVPEKYRAPADTEFYIVQFDSPIGKKQRTALELAGAEISHYVPNSALAVRVAPEDMDALLTLEGVVHAEPYHAYFKMSSDLLAFHAGEASEEQQARIQRGRYKVMLFGGVQRDEFTATSPVLREDKAGDRYVLTVSHDPDKLDELLEMDIVQWLEPEPELMRMNDLGDERIRVSSLRNLLPELDGSGVIINVTDSGIDYLNPGFAIDPSLPTSTGTNSRIIYYDQRPSVTSDGIPGDTDGHGTHVAGSIFGNGALSDTVVSAPGSGSAPYHPFQFSGMAPKAQAVIIEDFNSFSDTEQAQIAHERGARLSNNSWGANVFEYGAMSALWDSLVRDARPDLEGNQQYIAFFAAGNSGSGNEDGTGATASTIGQPGNAKNVITVGAVEQRRLADNLPSALERTDSDWQVSSFSSRGPVTATDLRTKPDIMAPGSYVLSVQSRETKPDDLLDPFIPFFDYRSGNVNSGTNFAFASGTSMATPIATGAGALFYQYYTNTFNAAPTPAMMKAALVGGARMLHSLVYNYPNQAWNATITDQGWGMVDINRSVLGPRIHPTDEVIMLDQNQTTPVATDEFYSFPITLQPGEGNLKIALAWTDRPGTPGNAVQLVNDIDLYVLAPGGGGFLGNVFGPDGVHSERLPFVDLALGDAFNNVEVISIKDAAPGTYTIRVYGWEVPDGVQDYALFIMKGVGIEGRTGGQQPAMDLDSDGNPVIAYSELDAAGQEQIFVKQWRGEVGDRTQSDTWKRMDDQWFGIRESAVDTGISRSLEPSTDPAIAVHEDNVHVAWVHHGNGATNIFMRMYNGSSWIDLDDSGYNFGITGLTNSVAVQPSIAVDTNGFPVVAWRQMVLGTGYRIFVARWNGTNWTGYGNSMTSGVLSFSPSSAHNPSLVINSAGNPVVAFEDSFPASPPRIRVARWNGASWQDLGLRGSGPLASEPSLDAGPGGDLYLAWKQFPSGSNYAQIYAERYNGSWSSIAGSSSYPGVSGSVASSTDPSGPQISYSALPAPKVTVSWIAGAGEDNSVLVRSSDFSSWSDVADAGAPPGVAETGGISSNLVAKTSNDGVPVVVFQNNASGSEEVLSYKLVTDSDPPLFLGLESAVGGTNNNVELSWSPAQDSFSTSIVYRIYQSTNSYPCVDIPTCNASEVFSNEIAVVTNLTMFSVTGLTNYQLYCFGVRAEDQNGFVDDNTVTLFAGPEASGTDCTEVDTDGDGMPDWWESLFFGGPTNGIASSSNIVVGVNTLTFLETYEIGTDPFALDSDGDQIGDWDEVYTYLTDPTDPDTDADGIPDGMEIDMESNPLHWDSNNSGVGDGDTFEVGLHPTNTTVNGYRILFQEDMEVGSSTRTNWVLSTPSQFLPWNFWHLSTAEPAPADTNVVRINQRSPDTAYRMAIDPTGTNALAGYNQNTPILAALDSPDGEIDATGVNNLFVSWREFYDTEPGQDFITVQARSDEQSNWVTVTLPRSGNRQDNQWARNMADLSQFAGDNNVRIRFLFQANGINNHFPGWYVDDVLVFEGATIEGWVRNISGEPVDGARVRALGRGGITNVLDGHRVIFPGKVMGEAQTQSDGSYRITGLPLGHYYVKANEGGSRAEFFNGELFTPPYSFGAGIPANRGVFNVEQVTLGYLDMTAEGSVEAAVHFELELGETRTLLGVAHTDNPGVLQPYVNNRELEIWNGLTNAPAFVPYLAGSNVNLTYNFPDWATNAVQPVFFGELTPGRHNASLDNVSWHVPYANVHTREGERTRTDLLAADVSAVTNTSSLGRGFMFVASLDGISHPIYLNGLPTGQNTPALIHVQAGNHLVHLVPGTYKGVMPQYVHVPFGTRTNVVFTSDNTSGLAGGVHVTARDPFGNDIENGTIILNGLEVDASDTFGAPFETPATIPSLREGFHYVSVRAEGFRDSETRAVQISGSETNTLAFVLFQADADYDRVGDFTEIIGYTNLFLYGAEDDPDADNLSNSMEFEMFRNFGILLNPFDFDTDGDGMPDGEEVGYSGYTQASQIGGVGYDDFPFHVMYGESRLTTNAVQATDTIRMRFVGRYLDGISNFEQIGATQYVASVEGDRFIASAMSHTAPLVPTITEAETIFTGIAPSPATEAIASGHPASAMIYADTRPDDVDTDGDGMWDGFEWQFKFMTNAFNQVIRILDPIETGVGSLDSDADGLSNFLEFLGPDGSANTNDWTDPRLEDTDDDGIPDGWEYFYDLDPNDPADAWLDLDDDNLPNVLEYYYGTSPILQDSDADDLSDGDEVLGSLNAWKDRQFFPEFAGSTDPLNPDTDNDDLLDGLEILLGTDPNNWDTDGDGMPDGFEVLDPLGELLPPELRLDPLDPTDADKDYSGDGMSNLEKFLVRDGLGSFGQPPPGVVWDYWLDPFSTDLDGDGMPDVFEVYYGLHPADPILSKEDEVLIRNPELGPGSDLDNDGLWNLREYRIRFSLDEDADPFIMPGLSTDPLNPDTDADGLGDGEEDRAFRTHPILQDTDEDSILDGTANTNMYAEVESEFREVLYEVIDCPGGCTWEDALALAAAQPHPFHPGVFGQLAIVQSEEAQLSIDGALVDAGAAGTAALGGRVLSEETIEWISGECFLSLPYWSVGEPVEIPGYLGLNVADVFTLANWISVDDAYLFDHVVVEYDYMPSVTNHYDEAYNDMWQLVWPSGSELPFWEVVEVATNSPLPPPRWGHAASYVPVFETKLPRDRTPASDEDTLILMDNRQLAIFGGRDGITKYRDVWEFRIRDAMWHRSAAPLDSCVPLFTEGRSEFHAITKFAYRNSSASTELCNSQTDEFGHPKGRPYTDSRSMDWTFMVGGWNDSYAYMFDNIYYKSTDDPRPITEDLYLESGADGVSEFDDSGFDGYGEIIGRSIDEETAFALGDNGSFLPDGDLGEDSSTNSLTERELTGYAAMNFANFALREPCDEIIEATLHLRVRRAPAADFDVDIRSEIGLTSFTSNPEYTSASDTLEPSARWGNPASYYLTGPITFTVPASAGFINGDDGIDVTELVQDILVNGGFVGDRIGFLFDAVGAGDYAIVDNIESFIRVSYKPSYKIEPEWKFPTSTLLTTIEPYPFLSVRKSHAMAYDHGRDQVLLFGGLHGNDIMGDSYIGTPAVGANPGELSWETIPIPAEDAPPPRWGHSMVFDEDNDRYVMFGGFDDRHRPLNDVWFYDPNGNTWEEFLDYSTSDRPQPRAGASMVYFGDYDYNRGISNYDISNNPEQIVMFGGTDGKSYFNDTWVFDKDRWILVNPTGELSQSPPPRAFASFSWAQNGLDVPDPDGISEFRANQSPPNAQTTAFLFGGRGGVIPTGRDSDMDTVDDGYEHAIGGPDAGRDPRADAMITGAPETFPYNYVRIGPVYGALPGERGFIANMESLRHEHGIYALGLGLPWEVWPHPDSPVFVGTPPNPQYGIETRTPGDTMLWYSKHEIGDPADSRNVWELGVPNPGTAGDNAVPPYAYSGRWVFGTSLSGAYPNNAKMSLYSPLMDLTLPLDAIRAAFPDNENAFHLVFHEWLDLADANDQVKVDMVRPTTPADIATRVTGQDKTVVTILGTRNFAFNTTGTWRRVIAPLPIAANESNVYLRFTLESDAGGSAGGWYLDDVAIIQGAELTGTYDDALFGTQVDLEGVNGTIVESTTTYGDGQFGFGLLPSGEYVLGSGDPIVLGPGGWNSSTNLPANSLSAFDIEALGLSFSLPSESTIAWEAIVGREYTIQWAPSLDGPWTDLVTNLLATSDPMSYVDTSAFATLRFYRVILEP